MAEKVGQSNSKPQVRAHARNLRISPRKIRLVTNLVKNMRVADALVQLQFTNKKAAGMVIKLLRSAVANAENNFSLKGDKLFIKSITTDMGPALKRMFPRARGSAFIIRRKMAHVNVVLEERDVTPKSSAKLLKTQKKVEPIQTQEGQLGKAETESVAKPKPEAKIKEVHRENQDQAVDKKVTPENLQR